MIRDTLRAVLVVAVAAALAAIAIEARSRIAAVDLAHQSCLAAIQGRSMPPPQWQQVQPPPPAEGRLQRFGRAVIGMADAAIGVVR